MPGNTWLRTTSSPERKGEPPMDEMKLIERFRADVPPADAQAGATARTALMEAMSPRQSGRRRTVWRRRTWAMASGAVGVALVVALAAPEIGRASCRERV